MILPADNLNDVSRTIHDDNLRSDDDIKEPFPHETVDETERRERDENIPPLSPGI